MPAWLIPAITGAASIASSMLGKSRTKTLVDREQKLSDIQADQNKSLALYNKKLQMDMWKETGPVGQMEQLGKAGLNPGLIYGMGGAGGQTAQAAQAAPVGRSSASDRTRVDDMMGAGIAMMNQIGLMQAQKNNLDANTEKTKAEATKIAGPDTHETESRIQLNQQGLEKAKAETSNIQTQEALTKVQTDIANVQKKIATDTQENVISAVQAGMEKAWTEFDILTADKRVKQETVQDAINTVRANYANIIADTRLKNANVNLTNEQRDKVHHEIDLLVKEMKWKDVQEDDKHKYITEMTKNISNATGNADTPESTKLFTNIATDIVEFITLRKILTPTPAPRNPIGYK